MKRALSLPATGAIREILSRSAIWLCPFRPFFLLTAAHALLAMTYWLGALSGLLPMPDLPGGPIIWHAHELIFGFAAASIAGFLLTAIFEFTGAPPVKRNSVQILLALWFSGRLAYALAGWVGVIPAALCDIAFMLMLIKQIAGPLWRDPNRRHLAFFHNLLALCTVQAGFYLALYLEGDAMAWLQLAVGLLMILIVVALSRISMRLVNDVLEAQGGIAAPYLARPPRRNLAIFSIAAYSAAEFVLPGDSVTAWLALAAAASVFNLLNDWHVGRALFQRWVMIPYLVYWCMALGYAIIGLGLLLGGNLNSAGHHLLLVGAVGLSILIVMAVAGRMHSGYGLDHRYWLPIASLCLLGAAIARSAAGLPIFAAVYTPLLHGATTLWLTTWTIYLTYSWKVLAGPRPDGGQGCDDPHNPLAASAARINSGHTVKSACRY
jgi:uncharacterized protein involved in response to NO